MPYDLWALYGKMLRCRLYEKAVVKLWEDGLISGELAAVVLEGGLLIKFKRVRTFQTIRYARHLEDQVLPNTQRLVEVALNLMN